MKKLLFLFTALFSLSYCSAMEISDIENETPKKEIPTLENLDPELNLEIINNIIPEYLTTETLGSFLKNLLNLSRAVPSVNIVLNNDFAALQIASQLANGFILGNNAGYYKRFLEGVLNNNPNKNIIKILENLIIFIKAYESIDQSVKTTREKFFFDKDPTFHDENFIKIFENVKEVSPEFAQNLAFKYLKMLTPMYFYDGLSKDLINFSSFLNDKLFYLLLQSNISKGNTSLIEALLNKNNNINMIKKETGNTAFMETPLYKIDPSTVQFLINHGADFSIINNDGSNFLHILVEEKDPNFDFYPILKLLLNNGVDVNQKNNPGETPLMIAAKRGNLSLIIFLLRLGADPSLKNELGLNAAQIAKHELIRLESLGNKDLTLKEQHAKPNLEKVYNYLIEASKS